MGINWDSAASLRRAGLPGRVWSIAFLAGLIAAIPGKAAQAEACRMVIVGTLPIEVVDDRATTLIKFNGQDTRTILDSGAFFNVMSQATAKQLGLRIGDAPDQMVSGHTGSHIAEPAKIRGMGGTAQVGSAIVRDFGFLGTTFHNAMFLVGGTDMGLPIVGANFLDAFDVDLDLGRGVLKLLKSSSCGHIPLAYWVKSGPYQVADLHSDGSTLKSYVTVVINGHPVRALIDTGAPVTTLSRHAAERSGIDLSAATAKPGDPTGGFGAKSYRTWIVPVDKFEVGTETIQNSRMMVVDSEIIPGDSTEMLLGLDFVLAHHMYIANEQAKIYFTYSGGRVFALARPPSAHPSSTGPASDGVAVPADAAGSPATAAEFALRGEAALARSEYQAAITDLDAAIRLEPGKGSYYRVRARAKERSGADRAGAADLDKALALDPQDVEASLWRARLRFDRKDFEAARGDVAAARKLAPEGSSTALMIAKFDIDSGQPDQALPIYDAWLRLHPADANLGDVLNTRCWARGLANQMLDGALADCRQAIGLEGPKAAILDSLGLVLLRQGKTEQAIATYNKALVAAPGLAWSLYGRGLAERHLGKVDAGSADLKSARAISPQIDAEAGKYGLAAS